MFSGHKASKFDSTMTKKTFTFMVLVLVAATALTAATAFAAPKRKRLPVQEQAVESTMLTSEALLWLKLHRRPAVRQTQPGPPPVVAVPVPGKIR